MRSRFYRDGKGLVIDIQTFNHIFSDRNINLDSVEFDSAHETAHYLHSIVNKDFSFVIDKNSEEYFFDGVMAHPASLRYFNTYGRAEDYIYSCSKNEADVISISLQEKINLYSTATFSLKDKERFVRRFLK